MANENPLPISTPIHKKNAGLKLTKKLYWHTRLDTTAIANALQVKTMVPSLQLTLRLLKLGQAPKRESTLFNFIQFLGAASCYVSFGEG